MSHEHIVLPQPTPPAPPAQPTQPPAFTVLSKDGCTWCDRAKAELERHKQAYVEVACPTLDELRRELRARGHAAVAPLVASWPQVLEGSRYVGGCQHLVDQLAEPVLRGEVATRRFTPFPVRHPDVWQQYKQAVASFWTVEEVSLAQDVTDWKALSDDERHFIKHILAFFAGADGIVMENLQLNFGAEVQMPEARCFYAYQTFNESQHSEQYALLIDALIDDSKERERLFWAIETMPAVQKKAEWAFKWLNPTRRFAERLLAFTCVEGILFSGSFCAIFWLRQRGLMPGLGLSNEFISRDEGMHQDFGACMYRKLRHRLTQAEAHAMVAEAVDNETEFITVAIPCRMVGMNADLMTEYIKFVADRLLKSVGYDSLYGASNPFPFMQLQTLGTKHNFFEKFPSEYQRAGVMAKPEDQTFGLDETF